MYSSVLKAIDLCVHMQNHASCEGYLKTITAAVLSDVDFILRASNFDDFAAFRAHFSYISTAHAQKRPLISFQSKF